MQVQNLIKQGALPFDHVQCLQLIQSNLFLLNNNKRKKPKPYRLFVSRVRFMECLLPDVRVRVRIVPHARDQSLQTPLLGLGLGGKTLIQDLKQD